MLKHTKNVKLAHIFSFSYNITAHRWFDGYKWELFIAPFNILYTSTKNVWTFINHMVLLLLHHITTLTCRIVYYNNKINDLITIENSAVPSTYLIHTQSLIWIAKRKSENKRPGICRHILTNFFYILYIPLCWCNRGNSLACRHIYDCVVFI